MRISIIDQVLVVVEIMCQGGIEGAAHCLLTCKSQKPAILDLPTVSIPLAATQLAYH